MNPLLIESLAGHAAVEIAQALFPAVELRIVASNIFGIAFIKCDNRAGTVGRRGFDR